MDYSDLHDAEINMKVCAALGLGLSGYARLIRQGDATILLDDNETLVDYCNNPADAWPIIVENKLSMYPSGTRWGVEGFNADDPFYFDDNPLRAAMIVFLLMQEPAYVQDNPA